MVVADMMCFEETKMVSTVTFEKTCSLARTNDGGCYASSRKELGKRKSSNSRKEAKCELVEYHSLPDFMKHNEFILGYYRSEWPLKQAILSIFSIHNETLNVWTHLIGFFVFLALTTCTAMMVNPMDSSDFASSLQHVPNSQPHVRLIGRLSSTANMSHDYLILPNSTDTLHLNQVIKSSSIANRTEATNTIATPQSVTRWPFYAFLCGAMFCLLMSSACHLLSCHSEHLCYSMLRLDYGGISALIVTSFYPLVYYTFMCQPFYRNLYIGFITVFGLATVLVSLLPVFEIPEFRSVRACLFFCMGVSGLVPIIHKVIMFSDRPEALLTTGYELVMGAFYAVGVVVYATRVPERWMPGKFDLVGHSHQLFHVLVIAGAYTHYLAGLVYLNWRDLEGCC